MAQKTVSRPLKMIISLALPAAAGILGSLATFPAIPGWYQELSKPEFTPPNWLFGPVWTALYLLMAAALYIIWDRTPNQRQRHIAMSLFILQLALNALWSILFFGLRSPLAGLIDIVLLWAFILLTIIKFFEIDRKAAVLLVPYSLWVSYALVLNLFIYIYNR